MYSKGTKIRECYIQNTNVTGMYKAGDKIFDKNAIEEYRTLVIDIVATDSNRYCSIATMGFERNGMMFTPQPDKMIIRATTEYSSNYKIQKVFLGGTWYSNWYKPLNRITLRPNGGSFTIDGIQINSPSYPPKRIKIYGSKSIVTDLSINSGINDMDLLADIKYKKDTTISFKESIRLIIRGLKN